MTNIQISNADTKQEHDLLEIESINNVYLKHSTLVDQNTHHTFINKHKNVSFI